MRLFLDPEGKSLLQKSEAIPRAWEGFLRPWAEPVIHEDDFGSVLVQTKRLDKFCIHLLHFDIKSEISLYPYFESPTIALQLMLEGDIPCLLHGFGKVLLHEGYYQLFYLSQNLQQADLVPGSYQSLHVEFSETWLNQLPDLPADIRHLRRRSVEKSDSGLVLNSIRYNHIVQWALDELFGIGSARGALPVLALTKWLVTVFAQYLIQLEEVNSRPPRRENKQIARVGETIRSAPHIGNQTVKALARMAGMAIAVFKRDFRDQFGISPAAFVRQQALERARFLTVHSIRSIGEIADELGYSSRSNLNRAFKQHYGTTPAGLRRKDR